MITQVRIRNFKRFEDVTIELGKAVVFIGPNNKGKTTALQALALWEIGLKKFLEKNGSPSNGNKPKERIGATINRNDLTSIPIPSANLLWRDLHVRERRPGNKTATNNIRIDIIVSGTTEGKNWQCGLEFDYANAESFYCRPLRIDKTKDPERMPIPPEAAGVSFAFLPPMSGLATREDKLERGSINVRIGEGRTAEVLRNLCFQVYTQTPEKWRILADRVYDLFGIEILPPEYKSEIGQLMMSYSEIPSASRLDLSCAGRGVQQTLLILAHLYSNPGTVLLLDEPDAHLEIIRQRQIYHLLTSTAMEQNCQVYMASHSEILLNEAAGQDLLIAFLGKPHRIDNRGSQLLKSLKDIGWEHYYQAESVGWVLYLEGSTDLAILQKFAKKLNHPASEILARPYVYYINCNQRKLARDHFHGIAEAKKDFVGVAIFDRVEDALISDKLTEVMWKLKEIENYFCTEETLIAFAESGTDEQCIGDLFSFAEKERRRNAMIQSIKNISEALKLLKKPSPFSADIKATDDFMDPLFESYYEILGLPNLMQKTNYHRLLDYFPAEKIPAEVVEKLDLIVSTATKARPTN